MPRRQSIRHRAARKTTLPKPKVERSPRRESSQTKGLTRSRSNPLENHIFAGSTASPHLQDDIGRTRRRVACDTCRRRFRKLGLLGHARYFS
jgi:hypothetical protein